LRLGDRLNRKSEAIITASGWMRPLRNAVTTYSPDDRTGAMNAAAIRPLRIRRNWTRRKICHADAPRSAAASDQPVVHDDDAVGKRERFPKVVGDVKKGEAKPPLQVLQFDLHVLADLAVDGAERLA
jgi:hypothetical protein